MTIRLLETKTHIPPRRPVEVLRPRLAQLMTAGLNEHRKLSLVSAPAGYGKSTLASEWLHQLGDAYRAAWLSLEAGDNEPARFLAYWLFAMQRAAGEVGKSVRTMLEAQVLPPVTEIVDEMINDLSALENAMVLVLDDFHVIHHPVLHQAVEYFIEHQPSSFHLVICTRQDPFLPLARLRARGQMTEIRARDLRFTPQEARHFFSESMNLDLAEDTALAVEQRTEGWAVGLQLAGLALRNITDAQRFIDTFRGSHRYVLDYLAEEVIKQQPQDIRAFLSQTSVLARFNADLCGALTGHAEPQQVLAYLDRANLFLVALDDEQHWYRYHHLFSDYLRTLLPKEQLSSLLQKASTWCETHNLDEEAVEYAMESKQESFAAGILERVIEKPSTWSGGNIAQLVTWLDRLPDGAYQDQPRLCLHASRAYYLAGRFELAEKRIHDAEGALQSKPDSVDKEGMLATASLYRGAIAAMRGDSAQAIELITHAQAHLPPDQPLLHARGFYSLGVAYELAGQTTQAVQSFLQSSAQAEAAGVLFLAIHARCAAAQVQISQGQVSAAQETCQEAIRLARGERMLPLGLAYIVLGWVTLERNQLDQAEMLLKDGTALSRQGGLVDDVVLGLILLTRVLAARGTVQPALQLIQEVRSIILVRNVPRMDGLAAAIEARLHLALGQVDQAKHWSDTYQVERGSAGQEVADLVLVQVLLASGRLDALPPLLQALHDRASQAGRIGTLLEVMLLWSLYHHARQETQAALDWIGKALRLAEPEGWLRVFLDQGDALLGLLPKARSAAPRLVDTLLAAARSSTAPPPDPNDQLTEPLSEQELRVLRLIMAGKTNQEIAAELVISTGTAKWHVHNVLQKLGSSSRSQAIARARELGF